MKKRDLCNLYLKDTVGFNRLFIILYRSFYYTFLNFRRHKGWAIASSLTYYTLLSIVPILALSFAIVEKLNLEYLFEKGLRSRLENQDQIFDKLNEFMQNIFNAAQSGPVATIGILILFFSVIKLLTNVEDFFVNIQDYEKKRPWQKKIGIYFFLFLLVPFFLVVSGLLKVFFIKQVLVIFKDFKLFVYLTFLFKLSPYFLIWILLWIAYMLVPVKKIKPLPCLISAIVAGTCFETVQWLYLYFQIGLSRYSGVYSSFASIPFFLVWLQISWLILLIGAELAYVLDNLKAFEFKKEVKALSFYYKKSLYVWALCNLLQYRGSFDIKSVANWLELPQFLVKEFFMCLEKGHILIKGQKKTYILDDNVKNYTLIEFIDKIDKTGNNSQSFLKEKSFEKIKQKIESFYHESLKNKENLFLKDLVFSPRDF